MDKTAGASTNGRDESLFENEKDRMQMQRNALTTKNTVYKLMNSIVENKISNISNHDIPLPPPSKAFSFKDQIMDIEDVIQTHYAVWLAPSSGPTASPTCNGLAESFTTAFSSYTTMLVVIKQLLSSNCLPLAAAPLPSHRRILSIDLCIT